MIDLRDLCTSQNIYKKIPKIILFYFTETFALQIDSVPTIYVRVIDGIYVLLKCVKFMLFSVLETV